MSLAPPPAAYFFKSSTFSPIRVAQRGSGSSSVEKTPKGMLNCVKGVCAMFSELLIEVELGKDPVVTGDGEAIRREFGDPADWAIDGLTGAELCHGSGTDRGTEYPYLEAENMYSTTEAVRRLVTWIRCKATRNRLACGTRVMRLYHKVDRSLEQSAYPSPTYEPSRNNQLYRSPILSRINQTILKVWQIYRFLRRTSELTKETAERKTKNVCTSLHPN